MSTAMVGDEPERKSPALDAGGSQKEIRKAGLINSFFQPIRLKDDVKSKLESEKPLNLIHGSREGVHVKRTAETEIVPLPNEPSSSNQKGKSTEKETCYLSEKEKLSAHDGCKELSQKERVKLTEVNQKCSLTCAIPNSSKHLSCSSSDFEEDCMTVLAPKTKKVPKAGKKNGKAVSSSKMTSGIQECDEKGFVDGMNKEIKSARKAGKPVKRKGKTRSGSKDLHCSPESGESAVENMESEDKVSEDVDESLAQKSTNTTGDAPGQDLNEIDVEENLPLNKTKGSSRSKTTRVTRTSAFDILMKSQRVQKLEKSESSQAEATNMATSESTSDSSCSCEVIDVAEKIQLKTNAPQSTYQSKSLLKDRSFSDEIRTTSSFETNAFDFLMKKGRLAKSPCGGDSQVESELDSEALENDLGSSKKKTKKKSFQLSIRASRKKNFEFSIESECASTAEDGVEETVKRKNKRQMTKHKKKNQVVAEGDSGESFGKEKCKSECEVSKSKRRKKKAEVERNDNTEEDIAVVSTIELNPEEKKKKGDKSRRKSRRKCASATKTLAVAVDSDEALDERDSDLLSRNARKNVNLQLSDDGNIGDTKDKKTRRKTRRKNSDSDVTTQLLPSTVCQLISVSTPEDIKDGKNIGIDGDPNEALSIIDGEDAAADTHEKTDNKIVEGIKKLCNEEPKPLAAIFLKRKTVTPLCISDNKGDNKGTTDTNSSVMSSSAVCSVNNSSSTTSDQRASDVETPQHKQKTAAEKEAANRAFKALFTGASSQKTLPVVGVTEALPAPWPSVSHVLQKDEDAFWGLPLPAITNSRLDILKHSSFLDTNVFDSFNIPPSIQNKVMFCGRKDLVQFWKLEKRAPQPSFPEAVTKKLLSELALFFPGVPLRKLYKRYSVKLEKHRASTTTGERGKQFVPEKTTQGDCERSNQRELGIKEGDQEVENKALPRKGGRGKRKLSSDSGICQEKKIARKSGDFSAELPSEDLSVPVDQSANKSVKKRGRGGDCNQSEEKVTKARRLSTRLQIKKSSVESQSVDDNLPKFEISTNRKKRKRTADSQEDVKGNADLPKEQGKSPDVPVSSYNEKTLEDSFVSEALWTDLYRPVHSTEVMANASAVSKLRSWLEEWKIKREKTLRKELQQQKKLLAKQKGKSSNSQSSSQTVEWWDADSDSDFQMSDDTSDDSDTESSGLSTAMFISGATGVGKTAMVYACAEELGYKVFEVNSSSKRSGKQILSQLEEATQSHLVINKPTTTNKGPVPELSFAGLFSKPADNSPRTTSPVGAFLQPTRNVSQSKDKKGAKERKGKNAKGKKETSKEKGKSILKQPPQALSNDGTESNLSSKAASLILFEEVDVIFEEDKSFWVAVNSFMQNAKCPIVLISTESQVSCEGRYEQITLKPPSVNLLSAHLQIVGLMNNMFVNPEDLKCLVAHNNCDIRKSLLNLQFWAASGGGVKTPYKRPASLKDKASGGDNSQNAKQVSTRHDCNTGSVSTDVVSSHEAPQVEATTTSGVLTDGGEESMFLTLNDWKAIKSVGLRRSSRSSRSGCIRLAEGDSSDSDFCEPKKKTLVCADGSTDSIFEVTDTNDSQPVGNNDKKTDDSFQLPLMDGLLFESVHGLLNCVAEPAVGSVSVLQKDEKPDYSGQDVNISNKLHLVHFSQRLGVDLTCTNLSSLVPLFTELVTPQPTGKHELKLPQDQESKTVPLISTELEKSKSENIFSDTSIFDDGIEQTGSKLGDVKNVETAQCAEKDLKESDSKTASSSQDSTDTGFSESQVKQEPGETQQGQCLKENSVTSSEPETQVVPCKSSFEEKCTFKALEIFAQFAENLSYADAFCPTLSSARPNSAEFGWWGASLKPGLTDDHVTIQESRDWLTRDTRASIRGALEVANLECCRVDVESLSEDVEVMAYSSYNEKMEGRQSEVVTSELCNFKMLAEHLPPRECNTVLRLDAVSSAQKSAAASRRKLYNSLGPCIPAVHQCNHRCVVCDYVPTFRLLCHSERLREEAHIKRRFLHYLDANSFPMSRSTMDTLADSYLGV